MTSVLTALLVALAAVGVFAGEPPVLDSVNFPTMTRSDRFQVKGSHLDQAGQIHLSGVPAMVWPIPGTNAVAMNGYVPEDMPYGPAELTVTTSEGTSNALPVMIVPRTPQGRLLWRFELNNQIMLSRPALGADGTVYVRSQAGDVIAITPHGAMKWLLQLGADLTPQIDVGSDGTIYTADSTTIYAIAPDGTVKWTFDDPFPNQGVIAGPNVGPDGNLYVVTHVPGLGILSLDPQGQLRWSGPDQDLYYPGGQQGQEIVFSDSQLFFCVDDILECFTFDGDHVFREFTVTQQPGNCPQPAVGPNGDSYVEFWGQLMSFDASGNKNWQAYGVGGSYLREPDVGADGTLYVKRNVFNTLHATLPDGTDKWTYSHEETLLNPAVDPTGDTLVIGGSGGGTSFFLALDSDGNELWEHQLVGEQHDPWTFVVPTPQGRGTWTPDSSVVYTSGTGPSWSGGHCYLYALQAAPIVELEHALAGSAGTPGLHATGSLEPGSPFALTLEQGLPGAAAHLVIGSQALGEPFKGGVLLPSPDLIVSVPLDATGGLQLGFDWPAGFAAGSTVAMQVWIEDPAGAKGFAASNALSLVTP